MYKRRKKKTIRSGPWQLLLVAAVLVLAVWAIYSQSRQPVNDSRFRASDDFDSTDYKNPFPQ